jgi:hypothetical protein
VEKNTGEGLDALETLTDGALEACRVDLGLVLALIVSREVLIVQLAGLINDSNCLTPAEVDQIKRVERKGADLAGTLREIQGQLRSELRSGDRQHSFTRCLTGMLRPSSQTFDL